MRRMETLWLKSQGLAHEQIAILVGISENTMREYFSLYEEGGVEKLKELNYYHPTSAMDEYIPTLEPYFLTHPPASIKEAQQKIKDITWIERSETQVREFFKKNSICVAGKSG